VFPELTVVTHLVGLLRSRLQALQAEPEAGYTTETIVVTALLVALALVAVGIIATKVIAKANSINTGP